MEFDPQKQLAHYRSLLTRVEGQAVALRKIVAGLEELVVDTPVSAPQVREPVARRYAGRVREQRPPTARPGLKTALAEITADGRRWTVDDLMEAVSRRDDFSSLPKRVSFTNRLNDLINEQYLQSPKRGEYELASPNGSVSSVDAEETDNAEPDGGQASLQEGDGLGVRPPGEPDQPPGRDPDDGATAGAARRT